MTASARVREEQRADREATILDAAWTLFARRGPDGASLRDVGAEAGCTHALVARYYGSKDGLVTAVSTRLATCVEHEVSQATSTGNDPLVELLTAARRHRACVQLLVRTALGDLPPCGFPGCLPVERLLAEVLRRAPTSRRRPGRRDRLCAYAAASLLLGFIAFEGFLVAATGLRRLPARRRDVAVAGAARHLLGLAAASEPPLIARDLPGVAPMSAPADGPPVPAPQALLGSAIELFAERGPASVSVRDVARHAGVNQGLIYRHFGSKQALLTEALEQGSAGLFPAALATEGFDFDTMSWLLHHASPAPRLIARTLVDDIDIATVRREFPVLRRLLDGYPAVPTGPGPGDLSDPRVAVTASAGMALGSVIWGDHLRPALGLSHRDGIESAVADLARVLIAAPLAASGRGPGR